MNTEFYEHLKAFTTNPYLFIGSGLSRRYLNLPTWENLLHNFFEISLIDGDFEYYKSKSKGSLPLLAGVLANEFHEIWWKGKNFKPSREKNKQLADSNMSTPLKIELSNYIANIQKLAKQYKKEIALFKEIVIDGVITTNWDTFLEETFDEFKVYIGQQELIFTEAISIGEIYKIHGCITKPESLILTDGDYANFNSRNAYLAAKLLTIFVEHPIIFLGYSISDENIQQIIDSIVRCIEPQNLDKLKDRLIFIEWVPDSVFEMKDGTMMLTDNKVLPIKQITTDSFEPIFETLSVLKRQIPVKLLRKLKNSVVELVKSSVPSSKIFVKDIDSITNETDIEYAIGVGIARQMHSAQGYTSIERMDVIEDVLMDNKNYDPAQLIEGTLPRLFQGNSFVPIYKYLKAEKMLSKNGTLNATGISATRAWFKYRDKVPTCFSSSAYKQKTTEIRRNHKDVNSIVATYDAIHALNYILLLEHKSIDVGQLKSFLISCMKDEKLTKKTEFRKLACLYDYLKYAI
jgi:hypothetical protein